ncbi:signal transduction histidine kinase [Cryobacterium sp. MP_M5]|uniref:sensor histidine kinase n=1 Tax=unclassified Cryobacterium TaxID=2649013 RepID=UPI0018C9FA34|nr:MULTISPECIES: sensor histidine kinase [unclassified Cryobacterium]MBG6056750.1 signal transduction histidine kinase [Cryobacterium sp. MP_M3]MEC5176422.1 signal transduction histidine kinase [Cryobacterium sp. MP_M5]
MTTLRWWDTAIAGSLLVMAVISALDPDFVDPGRAGSLITLAAIGLCYLAFGRRGLRQAAARATPAHGGVAARGGVPAGTGAQTAFRIAIIVGSGVAAAFNPNLATLQAIGFPVLWVLTEGFLASVALSGLLAVMVAAGLTVSLGGSPGDLLQAGAVETISFVFAVALGAWITRISQDGNTQRRLLAELTAAQDELAVLHRDAGGASERERLAREIHDTIAQSLTSLVMLAQRTRAELGADSGAAGASVDLIEDTARQALTEARTLVAAMSPVRANDSPLADTLGRLAERFARETGIQVDATVTVAGLDRELEVVLLRCAQEGLANVRKHSRAGAASVCIERNGDDVTLTVSDDGRGLGGYAPERENGFGLSGMRDRVGLVGGSLSITDGDPRGTVLRVSVPVPADARPTRSTP